MLSNSHFSIAVHVLTALALNPGRYMPSAMLASSVSTNPAFLRGLIGRLRYQGLIETRLGKGGGARLARDPEEVTLLEVYRATETGPTMATHECDGASPCPVARGIPQILDDLSERLDAAVAAELARTTVADLAGRVDAA